MSDTPIDTKTFRELVAMVGTDAIGELIDTLLEEAPTLVGTLRSSLAAGDADSFRRAAHSLKSNAATFGALALSERAKALEMLAREGRLAEAGEGLEAFEAECERAIAGLKDLRDDGP